MFKSISIQWLMKRSYRNLTTATTTTPPLMAQPIDYSSWSKEDLIAKITDLEQSSKTQPATATTEVKQKSKKQKQFDWSKHNLRFVALRFAYLGWNYNGLAYQFEPTPLPTVEETILKTLSKIKLIPEPIDKVDFSRCGRTDKGVSAMNQVISIKLRSNLTLEEQQDSVNDEKEIDYLTIINANLPSDIKIHSICLHPPPDFDARFSCKNRHYRYLFKSSNLDIELMNQAAGYYQGQHDFRNFCKLDGSKQITNFERFIYSSKIIHLENGLYCFDLIGTAFLWHQVRCMVAILFLVGQHLEKPEIVLELMDITKYPTKPQYEMANDIPLVLYDCEFAPMEWKQFDNDYKFNRIMNGFKGMCYDLSVKTKMSSIMEELVFQGQKRNPSVVNSVPLGDGVGRAFAKYTALADRERTESYDIINARWMAKKSKRVEAQSNQSIND
ncbi:DEG1 [Candida margitis]|uniref:DEG1 n=1 Tax=Candida margitis TaxID=1775924 RepID=UPI002225F024|nr:DEG1 [Candida margitis]KAI5970289.1 DEG1 [Candida margitis]